MAIDPHKLLRIPHVINRIEKCADDEQNTVGEDERKLLVVHRTSVGETAEAIAYAFAQHPELGPLTGYQMPYTFCVLRDGTLEQSMRVLDAGPHARAWSVPGIGVGVVGDFREQPPTPAQWHSLLVLTHVFSGWLGGECSVKGHDELKDGSVHPTKRCPGPFLNLDRLRDETRQANKARVRCVGVQF